MEEILNERAFSTDQRKKLAKSGDALPDGSYPIETKGDLENAVKAYGRKPTPAVKAHIKKRAKALGCEDCLPDKWESGAPLRGVVSGEIFCEAHFVASDSHDGLRSKLQSAVEGKIQAGEDMDLDGDDDSEESLMSSWPTSYVQQVHDGHVIYSMGGKSFAHKYTKDSDGDPHLKGKPEQVEHSYSTVAAAKESFSESCAFEPGTDGKFSLMCESFGDKGELTLTVIKPGWSKNNRYWPADLLKSKASVMEGAKMFIDHATDQQESSRPEGSIKDWVANITKVWPESDGTIKASAKVIDPQFKAKLATLGEAGMLNTMGVSVRLAGTTKQGEAEGKKGAIVESILGAKSVDFVTFAGAGGAVEVMQ